MIKERQVVFPARLADTEIYIEAGKAIWAGSFPPVYQKTGLSLYEYSP
jgi:hypothetical protein